jgi:hypothetical protein
VTAAAAASAAGLKLVDGRPEKEVVARSGSDARSTAIVISGDERADRGDELSDVVKDLRRIAWRVMTQKNTSTRFSHDSRAAQMQGDGGKGRREVKPVRLGTQRPSDRQ